MNYRGLVIVPTIQQREYLTAWTITSLAKQKVDVVLIVDRLELSDILDEAIKLAKILDPSMVIELLVCPGVIPVKLQAGLDYWLEQSEPHKFICRLDDDMYVPERTLSNVWRVLYEQRDDKYDIITSTIITPSRYFKKRVYNPNLIESGDIDFLSREYEFCADNVVPFNFIPGNFWMVDGRKQNVYKKLNFKDDVHFSKFFKQLGVCINERVFHITRESFGSAFSDNYKQEFGYNKLWTPPVN